MSAKKATTAKSRKAAAKAIHKTARPTAPQPTPAPTSYLQLSIGPDVPEPVFGEPQPSLAPTKYKAPHASDAQAYAEMDALIKASKFLPLPFKTAADPEPVITLAAALGKSGAATVAAIQSAGRIVFQSAGDTGATRGPASENTVVDKMLTDFANEPADALPKFFYNLGDIVYSFGEHKYYYDQFYEAYRNYPGPIFAIPGNHDGIVLPPPAGTGNAADSLSAFLENFCASSFKHSQDAVGLSRTTMIQPGPYFTLDAPFVRILGLYSNLLENPGVISSTIDPKSGVAKFPQLTDVQLQYLTAGLTRVKKDNFK